VIVEQIENEIGISYRPVHLILEEDLWMLHMCMKFVPYIWQKICPVMQFWWRTRFQPSSSHCIFQMLLRVTSGSSQVSKIELKGYYFASSKTCDAAQQQFWQWHRGASSTDREVLPALTEALEQACIWRRVVIVGWLRFDICCSYYITCPKAFGSFHVHCTIYPLHIGLSSVEKETHSLKNNKCIQNYR
jgi:hypothetical protein